MKRLSAARGFTLIELIVVIVVLGILSGIAIAGYTAVIRRANESSVLRTSETIARELTTLGVQKAGNASQTGTSADKTSRDNSIVWEFIASGDLPAGYSVAIEGSAGTPILLQRADGIAPVPAVTLAAIHSTPRYLSVARAGASVCVQLSADGTQGGDDGWKVVGRRNGIGACDDTTIGAPSLQYPQAANLLAWSALLTNTGSGSNGGTKNLDANGVAAPPAAPLAISYAQTAIPVTGASASLSPTVSGGSGGYSYSYSGVLPAGVTFSTVTGAFSTTGLAGSSTGALDTTFGNGLAGANNHVTAVALQPDGRILSGGYFNSVNATVRGRIASLNTDGTLDTSFGNGLAGANHGIEAVILQSDGKIVVGGHFFTANGIARGRIARLNADGTLDTSFGNGLAGAGSVVRAIALQPDGKVIIGGEFSTVDGIARTRIARLNADGSLDTSFGNGLAGANGIVRSIALQPDGKVIMAGSFTSVNGVARGRIARLNADGTLDTTFGNGLAGADSTVSALAIQPDGKILIGGNFTAVNGVPSVRIARLDNATPAFTSTPITVTVTSGALSETTTFSLTPG